MIEKRPPQGCDEPSTDVLIGLLASGFRPPEAGIRRGLDIRRTGIILELRGSSGFIAAGRNFRVAVIRVRFTFSSH
jgi:hypothetical protein